MDVWFFSHQNLSNMQSYDTMFAVDCSEIKNIVKVIVTLHCHNSFLIEMQLELNWKCC